MHFFIKKGKRKNWNFKIKILISVERSQYFLKGESNFYEFFTLIYTKIIIQLNKITFVTYMYLFITNG